MSRRIRKDVFDDTTWYSLRRCPRCCSGGSLVWHNAGAFQPVASSILRCAGCKFVYTQKWLRGRVYVRFGEFPEGL